MTDNPCNCSTCDKATRLEREHSESQKKNNVLESAYSDGIEKAIALIKDVKK